MDEERIFETEIMAIGISKSTKKNKAWEKTKQNRIPKNCEMTLKGIIHVQLGLPEEEERHSCNI